MTSMDLRIELSLERWRIDPVEPHIPMSLDEAIMLLDDVYSAFDCILYNKMLIVPFYLRTLLKPHDDASFIEVGYYKENGRLILGTLRGMVNQRIRLWRRLRNSGKIQCKLFYNFEIRKSVKVDVSSDSRDDIGLPPQVMWDLNLRLPFINESVTL